MASFNLAIPGVLKWEGGYVNNEFDPGGATNRGIILTIFQKHAQSLGLLPTIDALKSLTEEQAKKIYKVEFWDRMQGDLFKSQNVANITFDGFVNCGRNGLKILQREIGTDADGQIGPKTLETLNHANPRIVFDGVKDARTDYYKRLAERKPTLKVFLQGWLNRINSFEFDPALETTL